VTSSTTLSAVRREAAGCTACPLFAPATQTVFGEGPARSPIMLVGEQPGDREDEEGHPFVGPAGRVLRELLDEIGLPAERCYLTNAVKHFKFEQRGKRRLHKRPNRSEATACHPWLERELSLVQPQVVVALGVVAASSLLGHTVTLKDLRGELREWPGPGRLVVTAHPSSLLREESAEERAVARRLLLNDLRVAASAVDGPV
jgi:DNA polymerase